MKIQFVHNTEYIEKSIELLRGDEDRNSETMFFRYPFSDDASKKEVVEVIAKDEQQFDAHAMYEKMLSEWEEKKKTQCFLRFIHIVRKKKSNFFPSTPLYLPTTDRMAISQFLTKSL